jgi:hypothetical protein
MMFTAEDAESAEETHENGSDKIGRFKCFAR